MTKQDPIEMLLEDHKKVQTLFNDFNKSKDEAARQNIVNKVCAELTVHAQLKVWAIAARGERYRWRRCAADSSTRSPSARL